MPRMKWGQHISPQLEHFVSQRNEIDTACTDQSAQVRQSWSSIAVPPRFSASIPGSLTPPGFELLLRNHFPPDERIDGRFDGDPHLVE